jgi:hypothetical protein
VKRLNPDNGLGSYHSERLPGGIFHGFHRIGWNYFFELFGWKSPMMVTAS